MLRHAEGEGSDDCNRHGRCGRGRTELTAAAELLGTGSREETLRKLVANAAARAANIRRKRAKIAERGLRTGHGEVCGREYLIDASAYSRTDRGSVPAAV